MSDDEFLDPTDSVAVPRKTATRLASLEGKTITLLDISKAKGNHLLDRVEELLRERAHPREVLRRKKPDAVRPYKVWGYPAVPLLFIAVTAWLLLNTLITSPVQTVAGLGLMLLGLVFYPRETAAAGSGSVS